VVQDAPTIDWEKVLYVVFDLETAGHSRQRDEIIEVAGHFLDPMERIEYQGQLGVGTETTLPS
jgi:DNA polymerase III alpha subunit (gram-positive type)